MLRQGGCLNMGERFGNFGNSDLNVAILKFSLFLSLKYLEIPFLIW